MRFYGRAKRAAKLDRYTSFDMSEKPNLDLAFLEAAAAILERFDDISSKLSWPGFTETIEEYRKYSQSFYPTAHNKRNRKKCLENLSQERALFAMLSGESELAHYTHGHGLTYSTANEGEREAVLEAFSLRSDEETEEFRADCVKIVNEFTRLIEEIWKVPTVDASEA